MPIKTDFKGNIKTLLWIILIIILIVILLIPRKIINENFEILRGFTSETIYRDLKDISKYDKRMTDIDFMSTIDDQKDELIMKRCYQIPNFKIEQMQMKKDDPCKLRTFDIVTSDFTEVINKIVLNVQEIYDTRVKGLIHGPIYVLLSQIPYYKNDKGEDIALQSFNTSSYQFSPYLNETNVNNTSAIYYKCIIYYSRYSRGWRLNEEDLFKKTLMTYLDRNNTSFEPQCYIKGVGASSGPLKYGGCASSDGTIKVDNKPINSAKCLGPKPGNNLLQTDNTDVKNTPSTYVILYVLNNNADSIKRFLYNKDTVEYPTQWQYVRDVNVPLRQNNNKDVECLSSDGKNCLWKQKMPLNEVNAPNKEWQPVACGDMHKQLWGKTGYENPRHWCAKGYRALADSTELPKPSPSAQR